jgi:hypothetical protein
VVAGTYDHHTLSVWRTTDTGLFFCAGAIYLFIILSMKISKEQQSVIAIVAGLLFIAWLNHSILFLALSLIIAATFPFNFLLVPIHNAWTGLSKILGTISSHIILFIIFYFFLTPISLIRKMTHKKDSMRDFPGKENTGFYKRNHLYTDKDFLNPW